MADYLAFCGLESAFLEGWGASSSPRLVIKNNLLLKKKKKWGNNLKHFLTKHMDGSALSWKLWGS